MATTTKQKLQEDFDVTKQPQAQTAEDVNNQDSRTRLWQSLQTNYDYQRENTAQAYEQNKSAADRAALQRGMGRSSYNLQNMANIDTEKAKALTQIDSNQIADYQNRLNQLEQQELENEWREREFAENQRQYDTSMDFQKSESARNQSNVDREFTANRADTAWSQGMQEKQFDYTKQTASQQIAMNYLMNMLETGDNPSETLLAQAGISRKDYEQMKTKMKKSGGSGGSKNTNTTNTQTGTTQPLTSYETMLQNINNYYANQQNKNKGQVTTNTVTQATRGNDMTKIGGKTALKLTPDKKPVKNEK